MNAQSLAALSLRHAPWLRVAAVALAVALVGAAACANPVANRPSGPPRCADLVAHALASPGVAVPGAFACLSPQVQASAAQIGVTDDASFAQFAATEPVYTAYAYKGHHVDAVDHKVYYYFELTPNPSCWRAHLNSDGLVDGGSWKSGACPTPLP